MSAFMVSDKTLRVLAIECVLRKIVPATVAQADCVGALATKVQAALHFRNVSALVDRYGAKEGALMGSPVPPPIGAADVLMGARPSPGAVAKLSSCYVYQACDGRAWDDSPEARMVESLRSDLLRSLPGYDAEGWA